MLNNLKATGFAVAVAAILVSAPATYAQGAPREWEVGVTGGFGMSPDLTVKNTTQSASTGFKNGLVIGVFGGHDAYRYWSGEANYLYRQSDLKLEGFGQTAGFGAHTHIMTGDFLGHFKPVGSKLRPFVSFGGGAKVISASDVVSSAFPPGTLGTLASFRSGNEVLPVGEIGVGFKYQVNRSLRIRVQVRDFISAAPTQVIQPSFGAQMQGVVNDIVATGAFSFAW